MMKKILLVGTLVWMLACILYGCDKAPVNNSLEQHWQLEKFTILATSETEVCQRMFYGITRMVTEVARKEGTDNDSTYVARTFYEGENTLILSDFKVGGYNVDKKKDATIEQLKPFGIYNPKETVFHILKLTHRELVMESDYARLYLKKF